jgi:DNA-binding CsgD family transcriptional regulator
MPETLDEKLDAITRRLADIDFSLRRIKDEQEKILTMLQRHKFYGSTKLPGLQNLSPREQEAVEWLLQGLTAKQIADKMQINTRGVESHIAKAYAKTGTQNRIQLALLAERSRQAELFK